MSVSKKVSVSRTAEVSASQTSTPTQNLLVLAAPAVVTTPDPNLPIMGTVTSSVADNGTNSCYLPTSTLPYIGDPIQPIGDDWKRGLVGPNPGDYGYPGVFPGINTLPANFPFQMQQYWAVQRKVEAKGGPEFWVSNPQTWPGLPGTSNIVSWCVTENDAIFLCRVLNEHSEKAKAPVPAKTCSCNGINEECSNCPPRAKKVATITYSHAKDSLKSLEGRVLTVIDAAIESESRNKALKTLFKREFRTAITQLFDYCYRHLDGEQCEVVESEDLTSD